MYAIAIDGELVATGLKAEQVLENLRVKGQGGKVEVASFDPEKRVWIPVCLEKFGFAYLA